MWSKGWQSRPFSRLKDNHSCKNLVDLNEKINIPDFEGFARKLLSDSVTFIEVTGLNFFKDSFYNQGFTDITLEPWAKRKDIDPGRGILTQTANLRESIRVMQSSPLLIEFGTSVPYAAVHNNGGTVTIRITPKAIRFFWHMFKATGQTKWKYMALTKKTSFRYNMPKRQFIGHSETLMNTIVAFVDVQVNKFNQNPKFLK